MVSDRLTELETRLVRRYAIEVRREKLALPQLGISLDTLRAGRGRPLLLLPGVTLLAAQMTPLIARLTTFEVIAVDLPGHGRSEPFDYRGVNLRRHALRMLSAVLDALHLERVALIGHSLGAQFGLWLALDAPERLAALVALGDPAVALPGARARGALRLLGIPVLNRLALGAPTPLWLYRHFLAEAAGENALRNGPPELVECGYVGAQRPGYARTVASLMERVNTPRAARPENVLTGEELGRIAQPVLFIWGDHDIYLDPQQARPSINKMPNARLEIMPAGHCPWLDDPAYCADLITRFLGPIADGRKVGSGESRW